MRTAVIIVGGLLILGVAVLAAWRFGGSQVALAATKWFIAVWLVVALANLWMGVWRAGYSFAEELPIFLVIFAIPAAAAAVVWWKLS